MKLITPLIAVFIFTSFLSHSQNYEPLVRDNAHWVAATYDSQLIWYYENFREYYTDGDTVYNDIVYKKVYTYILEPEEWPTIPPYHRVGSPVFGGLLREDTIQRKVYGIQFNVNPDDCFYETEGLLFDFSVNQGDSLELCQAFNGTIYIGEVFYMNDFGYYRKHFDISYNSMSYAGYLIEGIGSTYGLFDPIGSYEFTREVLLCYTLEDISDCDISTDINQFRETKIHIYPNPVKDSYLYVKLPEDRITDYSADVTDIFGHILRHFDLVSSVEGFNLNSLLSGIYIIRIYNRNQIVLTDKIIKL